MRNLKTLLLFPRLAAVITTSSTNPTTSLSGDLTFFSASTTLDYASQSLGNRSLTMHRPSTGKLNCRGVSEHRPLSSTQIDVAPQKWQMSYGRSSLWSSKLPLPVLLSKHQKSRRIFSGCTCKTRSAASSRTFETESYLRMNSNSCTNFTR